MVAPDGGEYLIFIYYVFGQNIASFRRRQFNFWKLK